jgi:PEGA domain
MSTSKVYVAAILILFTSGCATIVKGTTQKVPVASDPSNADVFVDGNLVGQTPTTVVLKRKNDHLVMVQKVGFAPKSVAVVKNVGGAVWGNILAGGLIGWGVDAADGSQYNLIPSTVSVKLDPALTATAAVTNSSDSADFVSKLKALDSLHDGKELSDDEYKRARTDLFKKYMPEALPADVSPPTDDKNVILSSSSAKPSGS